MAMSPNQILKKKKKKKGTKTLTIPKVPNPNESTWRRENGSDGEAVRP